MIDRRSFLVASALAPMLGCSPGRREENTLTTQLNWLHDPTFVAHYRMGEANSKFEIREGGPSVFPIQAVQAGIVDAGICGFDIFARYVAEQRRNGSEITLRGVFCDFQRNPVGWVLHGKVASRLGIDPAKFNSGDQESAARLVNAIREHKVRIGDKVGTETTAVLRAWLNKNGLSGSAQIVPVGFDSSIVTSAPALLFPVYLNEEPYRLEEHIGSELLIVDPVASGVALPGNIVVMREGHPGTARYRDSLREAWEWSRQHIEEACSLVATRYTAVSRPTLLRQVRKTVELAFFDTPVVGSFDTSRGGRVEGGLQLLVEAAVVPPEITLATLAPLLL